MRVRTPVSRLARIQEPVRDRIDGVEAEIRRIILSDFAPIQEVSDYLALARGKLFRPTLLLLANRVGDSAGHDRAPTLGAVVELVHLATLVHDDAVDHSVLRRGMPTVNALWNHQSAIIMGDYLYSRAVSELATFGRTDLIAVLAGAANEMSVGEMRQLASADALDFTNLLTCRDLTRCAVGQCKYAPLIDADGGIVNDPVLLRVAEDEYWFSLSDSDLMFGLQGVNVGRVNDFEMLRELCIRGLGPTMIPLQICRTDLEAGRLERLLPQWCSSEVPLQAVYPSTRYLSPKVRSFVEHLASRIVTSTA